MSKGHRVQVALLPVVFGLVLLDAASKRMTLEGARLADAFGRTVLRVEKDAQPIRVDWHDM